MRNTFDNRKSFLNVQIDPVKDIAILGIGSKQIGQTVKIVLEERIVETACCFNQLGQETIETSQQLSTHPPILVD